MLSLQLLFAVFDIFIVGEFNAIPELLWPTLLVGALSWDNLVQVKNLIVSMARSEQTRRTTMIRSLQLLVWGVIQFVAPSLWLSTRTAPNAPIILVLGTIAFVVVVLDKEARQVSLFSKVSKRLFPER